MIDWQPIETAPDGVIVLGAGRNGEYKIGMAFHGLGVGKTNSLIDQRTGKYLFCTHWMPLPPLPTPSSSDQPFSALEAS